MGRRPSTLSQRRRLLTGIIGAVLGAALLGACGTAGTNTAATNPAGTNTAGTNTTALPPASTGKPLITASAPGTAPTTALPITSSTLSPVATTAPRGAMKLSAAAPCTAADLRADQESVGAGVGQYFLDWSLTNISASACTLKAGRPTLRFLGAVGQAITRYARSDLAVPGQGGAALSAPARLTVKPGHSVWFAVEESAAACGGGVTATGGPFHYVVGLPGGVDVTWAPAYLATPTVPDVCRAVQLAVGPLQETRPAAP